MKFLLQRVFRCWASAAVHLILLGVFWTYEKDKLFVWKFIKFVFQTGNNITAVFYDFCSCLVMSKIKWLQPLLGIQDDSVVLIASTSVKIKKFAVDRYFFKFKALFNDIWAFIGVLFYLNEVKRQNVRIIWYMWCALCHVLIYSGFFR